MSWKRDDVPVRTPLMDYLLWGGAPPGACIDCVALDQCLGAGCPAGEHLPWTASCPVLVDEYTRCGREEDGRLVSEDHQRALFRQWFVSRFWTGDVEIGPTEILTEW